MSTAEYNEGWKAHIDNRKDCPYSKGTDERRRWWRGWFDCSQDPTRLAEASTEMWYQDRYGRMQDEPIWEAF